jgi:hypothetical protein
MRYFSRPISKPIRTGLGLQRAVLGPGAKTRSTYLFGGHFTGIEMGVSEGRPPTGDTPEADQWMYMIQPIMAAYPRT